MQSDHQPVIVLLQTCSLDFISLFLYTLSALKNTDSTTGRSRLVPSH